MSKMLLMTAEVVHLNVPKILVKQQPILRLLLVMLLMPLTSALEVMTVAQMLPLPVIRLVLPELLSLIQFKIVKLLVKLM